MTASCLVHDEAITTMRLKVCESDAFVDARAIGKRVTLVFDMVKLLAHLSHGHGDCVFQKLPLLGDEVTDRPVL